MEQTNRPTVKLIGRDGNAFAVLGVCLRAARKDEWTQERIDEFRDRAMEGDYDQLLATVQEYFDVE